MLTLTVSACLPFTMDDSPHNNRVHRATAYLGLYLLSLGTGGIKPCTSALGADQFDGADPAERGTKASFFSCRYYFCINIGSLLSGTVLVWVQENIGRGVGFAVPPMVFMVLGLAVLARCIGIRNWGLFGSGRSDRVRRPADSRQILFSCLPIDFPA